MKLRIFRCAETEGHLKYFTDNGMEDAYLCAKSLQISTVFRTVVSRAWSEFLWVARWVVPSAPVPTWHWRGCQWSGSPGREPQPPAPLRCHSWAAAAAGESLQGTRVETWLQTRTSACTTARAPKAFVPNVLTLIIEKTLAARTLTHRRNCLGSSDFSSITFRTQKGYKTLLNLLLLEKFPIFSFHETKGEHLGFWCRTARILLTYQSMIGFQTICFFSVRVHVKQILYLLKFLEHISYTPWTMVAVFLPVLLYGLSTVAKKILK